MHAFDFVQNSGQVDAAVGFDEFSRREMFMVRECLQRSTAWIRRIIVTEDNVISPAMVVSIEVFLNNTALVFDELFEVKDRTVPELYRAGEKGNISGFSVDGKRVRRNEGVG